MKITYEQLEALDACETQLELFQSLFGDEAEVTRELVMKHADKFDWGWAAEKLLPHKKQAEYERIEAQASAEYRIKCARTFADCAGLA